MATSESSCGPTRGATSAEEEDDEAKNINQVYTFSYYPFSSSHEFRKACPLQTYWTVFQITSFKKL
jgi:hypothetical protein